MQQIISLRLRVGKEKVLQKDKRPTCNAKMRNKTETIRL